MTISEDVASKLLQIKAIQISPQNPFIWASGLKSPIYCDNRLLLSYPDIRRNIILALGEKAKAFDAFNKIAGVATAGIAHGALLAAELDMPFAYVRSTPKAHGKKNQIEGLVTSDDRILVIEDLISTGGSSLKAVQALRNTGASVTGVLAIFQYGFPEVPGRFKVLDCPFSTLSDYVTLLRVAVKQNYISSVEFEILQSWQKDPRAWASQYASS